MSCRVNRSWHTSRPQGWANIPSYCTYLSIIHSHFPTQWETDCIIPLHKSGETISLKNYRFISVIPCRGELLECLIHNQVTSYLSWYHLLSTRQSGFRKGYSTGTLAYWRFSPSFSNYGWGICQWLALPGPKKSVCYYASWQIVFRFQDASPNWFKSYLSDQVPKLDCYISPETTISFGGVSQSLAHNKMEAWSI